MRRRNWFSSNFGFYGLYKHICMYGESYLRPIGWASLIIYEATLYFWHQDVVANNLVSDYSLVFNSLIDSVTRSLSSLFPFFELEVNHLEDYTLRLVLLPILGTIFIGLRKKLERRFRH